MNRSEIRGLLTQVQSAKHDYTLRASVQRQLTSGVPQGSTQKHRVETAFTNWIQGGATDLESAAAELDNIINS